MILPFVGGDSWLDLLDDPTRCTWRRTNETAPRAFCPRGRS